MDCTNEENRKIYLSPNVARRVFSEQLYELVLTYSSNAFNKNSAKLYKVKLDDILNLHKSKYGYQIQPTTLGFNSMIDGIKSLPFIEVILIH